MRNKSTEHSKLILEDATGEFYQHVSTLESLGYSIEVGNQKVLFGESCNGHSMKEEKQEENSNHLRKTST